MRSTRQQRRTANGDIARGCLAFGIGGLLAAALQVAMLCSARGSYHLVIVGVTIAAPKAVTV